MSIQNKQPGNVDWGKIATVLGAAASAAAVLTWLGLTGFGNTQRGGDASPTSPVYASPLAVVFVA